MDTGLKYSILEHVIKHLEEDLEGRRSSYESTRADVIAAEGRMKTRFDSTKAEKGFLADGLAKIIAETQETLKLLRQFKFEDSYTRAVSGALIELFGQENNSSRYYLLLPGSSGTRFDNKGQEIIVLGPQSPLGRLMLGKSVGEGLEFNGKAYSIGRIE